jgi:hypothetical protein
MFTKIAKIVGQLTEKKEKDKLSRRKLFTSIIGVVAATTVIKAADTNTADKVTNAYGNNTYGG